MSTIEEGFLSRWSRRKRATAVPAPRADTQGAEARVPEAAEGEALASGTLASGTLASGTLAPARPAAAPPQPEFDLASLPPIESLTAETDITPFLRPQVPAALRSAALRRVWTLDPGIRDFVGPADYAWDFNAPDGMAGFSLELGGDVKKLLAQAIGLIEEEETPPRDLAGMPEHVPESMPRSVPVSMPLPETMAGEVAEVVAERPVAAEPAQVLRRTEAATSPVPAAASPTAAAADPSPPPRRHGTARPA